MRRALIGHDSPRAVPDTTGGETSAPDTEWAARHARTRRRPDSPGVRVGDPGEDWARRHGRTRR